MKSPKFWPRNECKFVESEIVVFDPFKCKYEYYDTGITTFEHLQLFNLPKQHPAYCGGYGKGVLATRDIPKGIKLGVYTGLWRFKSVCEFNTYLFEVGDGDIDAQCFGNIFRFINDPLNTKFSANVVADDSRKIIPNEEYPHIFTYPIVATCDIKAGQELFMQYGDDYWEMLRLARDDVRNQIPARKKIKHEMIIHNRDLQAKFDNLFKDF